MIKQKFTIIGRSLSGDEIAQMINLGDLKDYRVPPNYFWIEATEESLFC
jgi:hypothetical protein